ncbi:hypothetical protein [Ferrimonas gelatinilytica]|uniref:DUF2845 domain-containing protein n=1 Tax=Ferrimonas gelatinilytica TaxID=1255257 RepID=A0ABP9S799_9GAMM
MKLVCKVALLGLWVVPSLCAVEWRVPAYRCSSTSLIKVGDDTGILFSLCGRPNFIEQLEYPEGGIALSRYHFHRRNGQAVIMEVQGGRVTAIYRVRR